MTNVNRLSLQNAIQKDGLILRDITGVCGRQHVGHNEIILGLAGAIKFISLKGYRLSHLLLPLIAQPHK